MAATTTTTTHADADAATRGRTRSSSRQRSQPQSRPRVRSHSHSRSASASPRPHHSRSRRRSRSPGRSHGRSRCSSRRSVSRSRSRSRSRGSRRRHGRGEYRHRDHHSHHSHRSHRRRRRSSDDADGDDEAGDRHRYERRRRTHRSTRESREKSHRRERRGPVHEHSPEREASMTDGGVAMESAGAAGAAGAGGNQSVRVTTGAAQAHIDATPAEVVSAAASPDTDGDVSMEADSDALTREQSDATSSMTMSQCSTEKAAAVECKKASVERFSGSVNNTASTVESETTADIDGDKPASLSTATTATTSGGAIDVGSMKENILKALAEARSAMAGIKGGDAVAIKSTVETTTNHENASETPIADSKVQVVTTIEENAQKEVSTGKRNIQHVVEDKPVAATDVDEFDMFAVADGDDGALSPQGNGDAAISAVGAMAPMQSNYDDAEGYYKPHMGELLNGTYRVLGMVGKGVFSTVLRCQRVDEDSAAVNATSVAIKLIRNNEVMREAAQTEIKILMDLAAKDPRDKKHCVRLLERFEHANHTALVFESMQMNLREAMKKFGGKGGISLGAVRIFCKHLLISLSHLESCGIVHADIKPDNILLDDKQTMIKLCDFGSAFRMGDGKPDPTPYLVSRFYRAPEIVLGLAYDKAVDMWSVGCCLFEMFTGKVMFPGATNNEMLKLFMELKGKVPNKIIKKHRQVYVEQLLMEPHFTEDGKFCSRELDRVTAKPILRVMDVIKTKMDLGTALLSAKSNSDDRKQVMELRNLLERMFTLDSSKRITAKEALAHPFVKNEGKHVA